MFSLLTVRELNKLWGTLEKAVYHQADCYGLSSSPMWFDHMDIMWDVACEIDKR